MKKRRTKKYDSDLRSRKVNVNPLDSREGSKMDTRKGMKKSDNTEKVKDSQLFLYDEYEDLL